MPSSFRYFSLTCSILCLFVLYQNICDPLTVSMMTLAATVSNTPIPTDLKYRVPPGARTEPERFCSRYSPKYRTLSGVRRPSASGWLKSPLSSQAKGSSVYTSSAADQMASGISRISGCQEPIARMHLSRNRAGSLENRGVRDGVAVTTISLRFSTVSPSGHRTISTCFGAIISRRDRMNPDRSRPAVCRRYTVRISRTAQRNAS